MRTKLLELDISEEIGPVFFENNYQHYRVLIKYRRQSLGWINFSKNENDRMLAKEIMQMIKEQLDHSVIAEALRNICFIEKTETKNTKGISVVVCTRNRATQLSTCLQTLLQLDHSCFEIIVIDNAPSNDDTCKLVTALPVRYIREERPGLDWARNRGIAEAKYDVIAFTDDDVRVDVNWLQTIDKIFSDKNVMGASGYVAAAELETEAQHLFELQYGGMGHGFKQKSYKKEMLTKQQLLWASSFGIGANMAFRKEIFQQIGCFQTALDVGTPSHGGGDIEMFHRLVAKDHLFVYEPSMLVWHYHRREEKALQRQIFDNGRSFGCYLLECARKKSVSKFSILQFFVIDWFLKWNFKNLIKRNAAIPGYLSLIELYGMLTSPYAYFKSRLNDQTIAKKHNSFNGSIVSE